MNRYLLHASKEAVWRPCVTCTALGPPKETVGLCYCGEAFCHAHQNPHERQCDVAKASAIADTEAKHA